MSDAPTEADLLDQTLYIAGKIYDDPGIVPVPLDLHSACAIGSYDCVYDAIAAGKNINIRNKAGWTPLMYASYVGHDTVVNLLLESGADTSLGTDSGLTALMVAAGCGNESICYFLLQNNAEMDVQDGDGYTALCHAVRQGHQTVVQLLLEAGANLEIAEKKQGHRALMMAAQEGDEIIVDILVACEADLHAKDLHGHTARSLALENNHMRTVSLLDNALYLEQCDQDTEVELEEEEEEMRRRRASSELFIGAREMEMYQKTEAVRRALQHTLRRGSSLYGSLPEAMLARRASAPQPLPLPLLALKQRTLQAALSMPEQRNPPAFTEELAVVKEEEEEEEEEDLEDFLAGLGLQKYLQVFQEQNIDLQSLMSFTDEDLKRVGIKLLGPRRKLFLALTELRKRSKVERGGGQERGGQERGGQERGGQERGGQERRGQQGGQQGVEAHNRPRLMKQPSTELVAAYHQAMETVDRLEHQLAQEQQLRATTDSYLLELQRARQQASACVADVMEGQENIRKHCTSIKATHNHLSDEVECLRLLTSSTIVDPSQLQRLYAEVVSLTSRMRLELEALSRSVESAQQQVTTLSFHLSSSSSSSSSTSRGRSGRAPP